MFPNVIMVVAGLFQRLFAVFEAVVSTNLHELFVDVIIPRTIARLESITQVRDRNLGFKKFNESIKS